MDDGTWTPPGAVPPGVDTFGAYADLWLTSRKLKPRTRILYRDILNRDIPRFADTPLDGITKVAVRAWHAYLPQGHPTRRPRLLATPDDPADRSL